VYHWTVSCLSALFNSITVCTQHTRTPHQRRIRDFGVGGGFVRGREMTSPNGVHGQMPGGEHKKQANNPTATFSGRKQNDILSTQHHREWFYTVTVGKMRLHLNPANRLHLPLNVRVSARRSNNASRHHSSMTWTHPTDTLTVNSSIKSRSNVCSLIRCASTSVYLD